MFTHSTLTEPFHKNTESEGIPPIPTCNCLRAVFFLNKQRQVPFSIFLTQGIKYRNPNCFCVLFLYSCFEKGCLTNTETLTRQFRKSLRVMVGFTVAWANRLKVFQRGGRKQHRHIYSSFSFLVDDSPWTSIKQSQTLTAHNANRHCRVRFYTFVG